MNGFGLWSSPGSPTPPEKLKTVDYLVRYQGVVVSVDSLYAFLDRLHSRYKQQVERIVSQHTQKRLRTITVVFYDMTTLYFEAEDEDDWRKVGFSKDGKFQHPQIMLGFLVGEGGFPIGYDLFEGNTFEGHTLLPTLQQIQKKYGFAQPIVVADAATLSKTNLNKLASAQCSFIIGARIKNESESLRSFCSHFFHPICRIVTIKSGFVHQLSINFRLFHELRKDKLL